MERMYYAAARAQEIEPTDVPKLPDDVDPSVYLMPIKNLPQKFLTGVMNGGALPHLTPEQTNIVKVKTWRVFLSVYYVNFRNITYNESSTRAVLRSRMSLSQRYYRPKQSGCLC